MAGVQEQELRPRESKVRVQEIQACGQETNGCWGTGHQWLLAKEAMAGAQETYGRGPGNKWLRPTQQMVGPEDINGWGPGNEWLGTRRPMVGPQEAHGWRPRIQ